VKGDRKRTHNQKGNGGRSKEEPPPKGRSPTKKRPSAVRKEPKPGREEKGQTHPHQSKKKRHSSNGRGSARKKKKKEPRLEKRGKRGTSEKGANQEGRQSEKLYRHQGGGT